MTKALALPEARQVFVRWLEETTGRTSYSRLEEALTHPSFANESRTKDNQRLEFLGDAVLGLCISELLARAHPEADEGELTRMRSALVNAEALARWAREIGLGSCLAMGRGARSAAERDQTNVLADAVEAVVAAVYEDGGLESARALVQEITRAKKPVVAVDIPTGLHPDTGYHSGAYITADLTLTLGLAKRGLLAPHAKQFVGPWKANITTEVAAFQHIPANGVISLVYATAKSAKLGYPIVNFEYAIVKQTGPKTAALKAFLAWAMDPRQGSASVYLPWST